MKIFKNLMLFLTLSTSLSLIAMDRISDLLDAEPNEPKVTSAGAASLLKLAEIETECDDVTYFHVNYAKFKDELEEYKTAWEMRKNAIMPRLEALFIGSCQFLIGGICFHEVYKICTGEQKIEGDHRSNLYSTIFAGAGAHQLCKGYKNWMNVYRWRSVAHKKITNGENALKKLDGFKEKAELR